MGTGLEDGDRLLETRLDDCDDLHGSMDGVLINEDTQNCDMRIIILVPLSKY